MLNEQRRDQLRARQVLIAKNRKVVGRLFDVTRLLAKLNLPFRGHDETDSSKNRGVFRELVEFLGECDKSVKDHLQNSPANCTYLSHRVQNEMIAVLGARIVGEIVAEVKQAKFYAIMVDETTDKACHEQVSLVIRFVNPVYCGSWQLFLHVPCFCAFYIFNTTPNSTSSSLFSKCFCTCYIMMDLPHSLYNHSYINQYIA